MFVNKLLFEICLQQQLEKWINNLDSTQGSLWNGAAVLFFLALVLHEHHFSDEREFLGNTDLAIVLSEMYTNKNKSPIQMFSW